MSEDDIVAELEERVEAATLPEELEFVLARIEELRSQRHLAAISQNALGRMASRALVKLGRPAAALQNRIQDASRLPHTWKSYVAHSLAEIVYSAPHLDEEAIETLSEFMSGDVDTLIRVSIFCAIHDVADQTQLRSSPAWRTIERLVLLGLDPTNLRVHNRGVATQLPELVQEFLVDQEYVVAHLQSGDQLDPNELRCEYWRRAMVELKTRGTEPPPDEHE